MDELPEEMQGKVRYEVYNEHERNIHRTLADMERLSRNTKPRVVNSLTRYLASPDLTPQQRRQLESELMEHDYFEANTVPSYPIRKRLRPPFSFQEKEIFPISDSPPDFPYPLSQQQEEQDPWQNDTI